MNRPIAFLVLLFSCLFFADVSLANHADDNQNERQSAPSFLSENFNGGETGLADVKGKVILLHFWATWCIPCHEEMQGMEALWQKYKDQGLVVLGVTHDTDTKDDVNTFLQALKLNFPILFDEEGVISELYDVSRIPTTFLIDADGKIINRVVGTEDWLTPENIRLLEDHLSRIVFADMRIEND